MNWHAMPLKEVVRSLGSNENGLSEEEVQRRHLEYGKNIINEVKCKSKFVVFLKQFNSFLIYILILAAVISGFLGHLVDVGVIGLIIILNGVIGFIQEYKAEEIIEKLKKSLKYKAIVVRNGVQKEIDSKLLVPGDVVLLDVGDKVLADCRILDSNSLQVNEAVLTGESFPVEKKNGNLRNGVVLAERENMLYAGTTVSKGKVTAMVVETGGKTEFGKLVGLVQTTVDEKMPLEEKLDKFSRNVSIAIIVFVAFAFLVGVLNGFDRMEMFLVSVSLAIGAIPEGLPAIIAITLAVAIKQMYKVNTLIRKLPAAETLGRATVICTDKTGTLTEEELVVDEIYSSRKRVFLSKVGSLGRGVRKVLEIGVLCNDARYEGAKILGDPTEVSLIKAALRFNIMKKKLTEENLRVKEYGFDSVRKMMSIVRENGKVKTSYVKGAPSFILERCAKEFVNGKISLIDSARRRELMKILERMEGRGLRVLGFAYKDVGSFTEINQETCENNLTFAGFCGMIDPPRKEVKEAILEAMDAGINVKIITGDSAITTKAIAEKIGLTGSIIEGRELEKLSEERWGNIVRTKTIFARVTPQQKLKIVDILKKQHETVAVTGDGVNDILALKRADIGISMGVRGSDAARDSSDMVLLDDNFASIVGAVKQGRRVYDNIRKSIKFLLAANAGEVMVIVLAVLLGMPLPFLPLAILWMNLVTDSLPALALAVEPAEKNIMKKKPRNNGLLYGIWIHILVAGVLSFASVIWLFWWANINFGLEVARTMAITSAIFFELFFAFSCKSSRSLFNTGILNNKVLIGAVLLSAGLHLLAVYTIAGSVFGFVSLTGSQLLWSVGVGLNGLVAFEGWKLGRMILNRKKKFY